MSDVRIDEQAVMWSAGEAQRRDRPLLVVLHGYGSNESDLFSLSPYLPLSPVIAALRAPFAAPWPLDGYSWFRLRQRVDVALPGHPVASDATDEQGADAVSEPDATPEASINAVIDWLDALEIAPTKVGLLGFSQGAVLALELMRRQPERFSFAVNLSGFVHEGDQPGDAALAETRPPVFWGRGTQDEVITPAAIVRTTDWLPQHSTLSGRIYEGLGHAVSPQELTDISGFVERSFATS